MEFEKGQKVAALYDIFITDPVGLPVKQLLKKDEVYEVKDVIGLCCVQSVDVGFRLEIKEVDLLVHCPKCRKRFEVKYEETIWLWSTWFRPLDSYIKEWLNKLFSKNKNTRSIKIRIYPNEIPLPSTEPDTLTRMPGDLKPLMVPERVKKPETV